MELNSNIDIMEIVELFRQNDFHAKYEGLKDIVLFLGETGNGKSTLTEFLTGNQSLRSIGQDGQYVIEDPNGRIGNANTTILSQTSYPEPVFGDSSISDICYLDCPGFRDTRNSTMDICCTVFTKMSLLKCRAVKLILVISYDEVKIGGQRSGFLELVKHTSEFVRDPKKFQNSIALFVTKVPNITTKVNGQLQYVSDDDIKKHIAKFLGTVKLTIREQKDIAQEKQAVYQNALLLVDSLLGNNGANSCMPRIGIFRCPDEEGPLQNIELLQRSKSALNSIIHRILVLTEVSPDDFGYTISADTKHCILDMIGDIIEKAAPLLESICKRIEETNQKFEARNEIEVLYNGFNEQYKSWEETATKLQRLQNTSDVLDCLQTHFQMLFESYLKFNNIWDDDLEELNKELKELKPFSVLITLLETVSNHKFPISTTKWKALYKRTQDVIYSAKTWYSTTPLMIYILKSKAKDHQNNQTVREFLEKLGEWIEGSDPISGDVFLDAFKNVSEEGFGLQIEFQISVIKLKHLKKLCDAAIAGTLDAGTENFLYSVVKSIIRGLVLHPSNFMLGLCRGDFGTGIFSEIIRAIKD